jgi:hypothetical protein
MLPASVNGRPISPKPAPSIISRTTILILSGVLMGIGVGHASVTTAHRQALCASVAGLVSYLGLSVAARKRHREAIRTAVEQATWNLNTRLDKFTAGGVDSPSAPHHRSVPVSTLRRFVR